MRAKIAYIGGGSLFVPSVANGIGEAMRGDASPFEVELSLYDIQPTKAERMAAYARVVAAAWAVPLRARSATSREEALDGADMVILSAWLAEEHRRLERLHARLGYWPPEEGPGVAGWAAALGPWSLEIAAEMRRRCPEGLFVTLMNPTDVLAGAACYGEGVRAAGLCVELDGLRGALAHYFRVPCERIELAHAGVNHDGWVLALRVDGQNGYALWQDRWEEIAPPAADRWVPPGTAQEVPDYHPGNRGIRPILALTGHLRSSAYHNWPLGLPQKEEEKERYRAWSGKREMQEAALVQALQTGEPIADPAGIHPERSRLNYPHTGLTLGQLARSLATNRPEIIPLQVPNRGAIANFPEEAIVEVQVLVRGRELRPLAVGCLPEWLGGVTRLLALQRSLIVRYLLEHQLQLLKQALSVMPLTGWGSVQQLNSYAEALHEEFARE